MLIVEYKPEWANNFAVIKQKLSEKLAGLCIKIEHVGSTAVEGLSAKEIIDIDIVYNEDFQNIKTRLESFGYHHNGNQGITGREVFKRNKETNEKVLDEIQHHLYVCRFDCLELQRHILFRNYLRKSEEAKFFYMNQKKEIAKESKNDRKAYAELKEIKLNAFINYIIELSRKDNLTFEKIKCE
jgi:GrpB-like predicted nucleotidyltransferase (UPF0157 family)